MNDISATIMWSIIQPPFVIVQSLNVQAFFCVCLICSSSTLKSNAFCNHSYTLSPSFTTSKSTPKIQIHGNSIYTQTPQICIQVLSRTLSCTILVWIVHFLVAAYIAFCSKDKRYPLCISHTLGAFTCQFYPRDGLDLLLTSIRPCFT